MLKERENFLDTKTHSEVQFHRFIYKSHFSESAICATVGSLTLIFLSFHLSILDIWTQKWKNLPPLSPSCLTLILLPLYNRILQYVVVVEENYLTQNMNNFPIHIYAFHFLCTLWHEKKTTLLAIVISNGYNWYCRPNSKQWRVVKYWTRHSEFFWALLSNMYLCFTTLLLRELF